MLGCVTAAANVGVNVGVADQLFQWHGRWKSNMAKDGYIEDSLVKYLEVTKSLGL